MVVIQAGCLVHLLKLGVDGSMNKALFLDRDGVLNVDRGYVSQIGDFEFVSGVFATLRLAQKLGYKLIVVTNQSGIARGL